MIEENRLTIIQAIEKSAVFLDKYKIEKPKIDAEWIIAHVLGCGRLDLYLKYGELIPAEKILALRELIVQRAKRVPLQYLLKEVEFAGIRIKVDKRALIPRPETELLVENICHRLGKDFSGKIADLGTGTGAIILALCNQLKKAVGFGFDKFECAISLFKENILQNNLEDRVKAFQFDWAKDDFTQHEYQLIVSNPPYLSQDEWERTEPEVKENEPINALISEKNGFADIEKIIGIAKKNLPIGGILSLEIGVGQSEQVKSALADKFEVDILKDYHKLNRFVIAQKLKS